MQRQAACYLFKVPESAQTWEEWGDRAESAERFEVGVGQWGRVRENEGLVRFLLCNELDGLSIFCFRA